MQTQTLDYQADGLSMKGHLAHDPSRAGFPPRGRGFAEAIGRGENPN